MGMLEHTVWDFPSKLHSLLPFLLGASHGSEGGVCQEETDFLHKKMRNGVVVEGQGLIQPSYHP